MKKLLLPIFMFAAAQFASADVDLVNVADSAVFDQASVEVDWDHTVANDKWLITQIYAAVTAVPSKVLWAVIGDSKKRAHIYHTITRARKENQAIKGVVGNLNHIIAMEPSLAPYRETILDRVSDAYPRHGMIDFLRTLQTAQVPITIATNCDFATLKLKTKKLNERLAEVERPAFIYDACYCAGESPDIKDGKTPDGMPAGCVAAGKDSDDYFKQLFGFTETTFKRDRKNTLFIFIDDKKHNVDRARAVAQKEGVSLLAVHRNKSDAKIVKEMCRVLKKHAPYLLQNLK